MDWLPWVIFPAILGAALAILGAALVSAHLTHRGRVRSLRALADGLEEGVAETPDGFLETLPGCRVGGSLGGRDVRVTFERHPPSGSGYLAHVSLGVRHPAATFEVTDAGPLARLGRRLGLSKDPIGLQDRELHAGEGKSASLLQATEVHTALRLLLALPGVRRVALGGDALLVDVEVRGDLAALRPLLDAMLTLARPCDRAVFHATPAERAEALAARFAWTGGGSSARCPYCRDDLTPEADVAGCERCGTVHHRECLNEAGGCTVFGCGAREVGRGRDAPLAGP